jgi:hypothetical protein
LNVRFALLAISFVPAWGQERAFQEGLYPVLEKAGCRACHNPDGVAAGTQLHFPDADAPPEKIQAFGRSLVALVDRARPDRSLLLNKPTKRVPHAGGERIQQGSQDEAVLKGWIEQLTHLSGDDLAKALNYREEEAAGGRATPQAELRRLTHSQYNHTVHDLLGDQTSPADQFPPEDFINGFRNQIQGQSLSPLLIEAYSAAAEKLARNVFRSGDTHGLIPCKPSAACRTRFVREFGLKAFRRPLEADEQSRHESLMKREPDFVKGAQLVVEAMLQSSSFLFRLDGPADPKWKPYVAASRLSYSMWDTMPDAELFAAATRGDLGTPQGVEKVARRMLDDPRAHAALNEFVGQWLRFDRILTASKDRRKYPTFQRETAVAMTEEALHFVGDLVWNDRNFMNLFTAKQGFVDVELGPIYNVPVPAKEFDRVDFPQTSERAGILGQALFLALTAKPEDSSPTARGLFVREQFLCQHVPDPPAGVNTNLPPVTEAKPQTNRDRMSEHVNNPSCATCHQLIDPIGFGLEKFDAVGKRRDKFTLQFFRGRGEERQRLSKSIDLDIDTAGFVAGIPDSTFRSPAELGNVLAKSSLCQDCMVKQYFRYTMGRRETPADRPVIRKLSDEFKRSEFHFKELIVSLARLREFPNSEDAVHAASNHQAR